MSGRPRAARRRALGRATGGIGALFGLGLFAGCLSPVENPSEYDLERPLCDSEYSDEWRAIVEACRHDVEREPGSCQGVLSFSGTLESRPVTVESMLDRARLVHRTLPEEGEVLSTVELTGKSPYFVHKLTWLGVGGDLEGGADGRTLKLDPALDDAKKSNFSDDAVTSTLLLSVGSDARAFHPTGELFIAAQSEDEVSGSFVGQLGSDEIRGCFHAFGGVDEAIAH